MSIKINELSEGVLSDASLLAQADSNGVAYKNTIAQLKTFLNVTNTVLSVAGKTGVVVLESGDITDFITEVESLGDARYLQLTGGVVSGDVKATSFIKDGGTSNQFLKADGSVDTTVYASKEESDSVFTSKTLSENISFGESYASNYRSRVLDSGGTVFPRPLGYEIGLMKEQKLFQKAKLSLLPSGVGVANIQNLKPKNDTFVFFRNTTATYVDEDGLIAVAPIYTPRLNYPLIDGVVNGCPSLLLEPSRTNLIPYSEDLSNSSWIKTRGSIVSNNAISPDGTQNADKFIEDTTASNTHQTQNNVTVGNVSVTSSVFIKADTRSRVRIQLSDLTTGDYRIDLNLNNESVLENNGGSRGSWTNTSYKIDNFPNNWYKISLTATKGAGTQASLGLVLLDDYGNAGYTGDGTSGLYIWGAQVEAGSYPTSYIPTNGSQATRSAETCNNAGDVNTFNDSEGVLMAEISALADDGIAKTIELVNSSNSDNRLSLIYRAELGRIQMFLNYTGATSTNISVYNVDKTNYIKIVCKYKNNDMALWVNGFEVATSNTGTTSSNIGFSKIQFSRAGTANFYGNTKQIQYFDKALTDTDLEELTSWQSFNEMAESQQYTIL